MNHLEEIAELSQQQLTELYNSIDEGGRFYGTYLESQLEELEQLGIIELDRYYHDGINVTKFKPAPSMRFLEPYYALTYIDESPYASYDDWEESAGELLLSCREVAIRILELETEHDD